ncbi:MAG: hypothetical protein M3406_00740 [Chloroflexota bacterium]|nr:hypothetical protein [Chloroflexota bacterium]
MTVPVSRLPRWFDRLVPGDGGGAAVTARKVEYLDAHDEKTVDLHGRGVSMPTLMGGRGSWRSALPGLTRC